MGENGVRETVWTFYSEELVGPLEDALAYLGNIEETVAENYAKSVYGPYSDFRVEFGVQWSHDEFVVTAFRPFTEAELRRKEKKRERDRERRAKAKAEKERKERELYEKLKGKYG